MAAFEAVSRIRIHTLKSEGKKEGFDSLIDMRFTKLPKKTPPFDDFDPRDYREPKTKISPWMAYFNMVKSVFGAGLLGMPMAISQAGVILGPIMTCLVAILVAHTHLVLLWCLVEIARRLRVAHVSYRYGFRLALLHGPPILHTLGHCGTAVIAVCMILSQIGICTVFILFTSDTLRDLADWDTSVPALMTLYFPYLIMECAMKNLRRVSYVSMAGNIMTITGLIFVFYEMYQAPRQEVIFYTTSPIPICLALGTMLFNLSAVGVMLSCEKALGDPKIMSETFGVIPIGIMVPSILSIIFGILGYISFGTMEENLLRYLPFDEVTSHIAFVLYLVAVSLSYPLQLYPMIQILLEIIRNHDPNVIPLDRTMAGFGHVARPICTTLAFVIAYFVPFQGPFVAFVGSLCTTLLVLVFPALTEIGLLYPDEYGPYNYLLIKDLLIVLTGVTIWVVGVYLCGKLIYIKILAINFTPNSLDVEKSIHSFSY